MPDNMLTKSFNAQSIPELDAEARKAVKGAYLVMIFDKDTPADNVAQAVVDAYSKTGVQRFDVVSHDPAAPAEKAYQKAFVSAPYWSMDAWADAEGGVASPLDVYKFDFSVDVAKAWRQLQQPATVDATFSGKFTISAGMSAEEIRQAAQASIDAAIAKATSSGLDSLQGEEDKRAFDGKYTESLAHKGVLATLGDGADVKVFAYIPGDNWQPLQDRVLKTAQALQLPAGSDFNAIAVVALPTDDAATANARNEKNRDAVIQQRRAALKLG